MVVDATARQGSEDVQSGERARWSFVVAIAVACAVTLPLLGAVGFFDPWETNYAEVAREMGVRDDFLYPFWKDSYFFSKPILLFWLTAPLYKLIGADDPSGPIPQAAELVGRLPSALFAILCVGVVYFAAVRLWSRRAALLSSVVLSTSIFWAYMSRQAITDMPYVATAAAGLLLLAVALFDDDTDEQAQRRVPRWLLVVVAVCVVPQLLVIARDLELLRDRAVFGSEGALRAVVGVVLVGAAAGFFWWLARSARDPLVLAAALLFALSTLAKGPVGMGICGLVLLIAVFFMGEQRRLLRPSIVHAAAVYLAVAAPWPIVMLLFDGRDETKKTWFERFVLWDLLGRVGAGVHGERGGIEYYVRYGAYGLLPWTGLFPVALFSQLFRAARPTDKAQRFTFLVVAWAAVTFLFFAATTTKFHHYIFPLVVPAALLIGRTLDEWLDDLHPAPALALLIGCVITALVVRDLTTEPWELIDLFTYHYVSFKPSYYFPEEPSFSLGAAKASVWQLSVAAAGFATVLAMVAGAVLSFARPAPRGDVDAPRRPWLFDLVVGSSRSPSVPFVLCAVVAAFCFSIWSVQVFFNQASQHWSQRWMFETYDKLRQGDEALISYQMDWKGETFYGKNRDIQIKKSATDLKKAVDRPGRAFVLVQTDRLGSVKSALGREYESKIRVVDQSNKKWYLILVED